MGDGDRNRMGKKQLEVVSPLVATKEKKGVGVIKTDVNLFIRGDFYCTFRIKLRASAVSEHRTDPPELVWLEKHAESVTLAENIPGNGRCARRPAKRPVPPAIERWDPSLDGL